MDPSGGVARDLIVLCLCVCVSVVVCMDLCVCSCVCALWEGSKKKSEVVTVKVLSSSSGTLAIIRHSAQQPM